MKLLVFDFDDTLMSRDGSPEVEVLSRLIEGIKDENSLVIINTGRPVSLRKEVADWIGRATGKAFPLNRILLRWQPSPAEKVPSDKRDNLAGVLDSWPQHNPTKAPEEVSLYDNDPEVLRLYGDLVGGHGIPVNLHIISADGHVHPYGQVTT